MTMAAEDVNAAARALQGISDSDHEFLERVAHEASSVSGDSAPRRFAGEGHRLLETGPYAFSGAHGTMAPINVGDDEVEIHSAQPYPIDVSDDSLIGYVAAEPGRQSDDDGSGADQLANVAAEPGRQSDDDGSGADQLANVAAEPGRQSDDDGSGAVPLAADSVDARGLGVDAHVSDSVDSAGAVGVAADADGLWAANSLGEGATAETPLTQAYADEGVVDPEQLAYMPASEDELTTSVASASVVCSEAESSTSTAAPIRGDLPCVTYFPKLGSDPVPRCQKCGREVDPLRTRQTRQGDGKLPGGIFKCKACNVRHVQSVGLFGEWPTDMFRELDEKTQEAFWRAPGNTKAELEANVKKNVIRSFIQRRTAANKGSYQPISWYERQGYDVVRIEAEITDTKVILGLGLCYKVFMEEETFESIDELVSKKLRDMKKEAKEKERIRAEKKESASGASASATEGKHDFKRGRSSSSDSSSSSKRRRKERKAERKSAEKRKAVEVEVTPEELAKQTAAKEKEQKLAEKEAAVVEKKAQAEAKKKARIEEIAEKKVVKERKAAAKKMSLLLAPAIRNLQGGLSDPEVQHVPAFALVSAKKSLKECLEIFEEMQQKKGEDNPADLSVDVLDVSELSKAALVHAKSVHAGLALVHKLRSTGNGSGNEES